MNQDHVNTEIAILVKEMQRIGTTNADGAISIKFKVLFEDDTIAQTLESLAGTLKAAKKQKVLTYKGQLLLQGMSDDEDITLTGGGGDAAAAAPATEDAAGGAAEDAAEAIAALDIAGAGGTPEKVRRCCCWYWWWWWCCCCCCCCRCRC